MMNFSYGIPVAIFGATATIVMVQTQVAMASSAESIRENAKQITVLVRQLNGKDAGSGVILARTGSTHYVITAFHVVEDPIEYEVVAPDGSSYSVSKVTQLEGVDLALMAFTSNNKKYQLAKIPRDYLSDKFPAIGAIIVSGYSTENSRKSNQLLSIGLLLDPGFVFSVVQNSFSYGYEFVYTNQTQKGMSGGAVLDASGRLIGIHGRSEGSQYYEGSSGKFVPIQLGFSLGIPMNRFWRQAATVFKELGVRTDDIELNVESLPSEPITQQDIELLSQGKVSTCTSADTNALVLAERGNRLYRLGRFQQALECYKRATDIKPNFSEAWYARGFITLNFLGGNIETSLELFEKATQLNPNFTISWRWRGEVLYRLGRYPEALEVFEKATDSYCQEYNSCLLKGITLLKLERYEEALTTFNKVIQYFEDTLKTNKYIEDPLSYHFALLHRGSSLLLLKQYDRALESYKKAIEIYPYNSVAWTVKGLALILLKQNQEAATALEQAVKLPLPNDFETLLILAKSLNVVERYEQAIYVLSNAIKIKRNNPELWFELGEALSKIKSYKEAIQAYDKAIEIEPNYYLAWFSKGLILQYDDVPQEFDLFLEQYRKVITFYDQAIKIKPDFELAIRQRQLAQSVLEFSPQACFPVSKGREVQIPNRNLYVRVSYHTQTNSGWSNTLRSGNLENGEWTSRVTVHWKSPNFNFICSNEMIKE